MVWKPQAKAATSRPVRAESPSICRLAGKRALPARGTWTSVPRGSRAGAVPRLSRRACAPASNCARPRAGDVCVAMMSHALPWCEPAFPSLFQWSTTVATGRCAGKALESSACRWPLRPLTESTWRWCRCSRATCPFPTSGCLSTSRITPRTPHSRMLVRTGGAQACGFTARDRCPRGLQNPARATGPGHRLGERAAAPRVGEGRGGEGSRPCGLCLTSCAFCR